VQFRIDDADFGSPVTLSGGSATSTTSTLSAATHAIQAVYSGDANFDGSTAPVLVQTVEPSNPVIAAVRDVPNDQGGHVFLTWRCRPDQPGTKTVTGYRIWRRVPNPATAAARSGGVTRGNAETRTTRDTRRVMPWGSVEETFWEAIANLPAAQLVSYGYTAPTTQDSIAAGNPYTAFFVSALTSNPSVFYQSNVDSGYSVDNIPPEPPPGFAGTYGGNLVSLRWNSSGALDLSGYRLYRGASSGFAPGPGFLIASEPDTAYADGGGGMTSFYKLTAIDRHGNKSAPTTVHPLAAP